MSKLQIICDLCDQEVKSVIKEEIWVCPECAEKYPRAKTSTNKQEKESC